MSIGWGFVGTGGIAETVAAALDLVPGGRLAAVCSRDRTRAQAFADEHAEDGATGYDDVAAMLADPAVDAVYVATTHPQHHAPARTALEAGVPVLVEKPLTVSLAATRDLVDLARERSTFLMEAYWTRFLPGTAALLDVVAEGRIGQVLSVHADFGFAAPASLTRFHDPAIGGGSLFDLGPYPVGLALTLLGAPSEVLATGSLTASGVDRQTAMALSWPDGEVAALSTTMAAATASGAWIEGSEGWIAVDGPLPRLDRFTVHRGEEPPEVHEHAVAQGHRFMLEHVHTCLAEGRTESPQLPLQYSLDFAGVVERVVESLGIVRAAELAPASE